MQEYKDHFDLDDEFEGHDIHVVGVKKSQESPNEKPHCSTRKKNPINRYGYDEYMAYHYAFMMKVASVREPETLPEGELEPDGCKERLPPRRPRRGSVYDSTTRI